MRFAVLGLLFAGGGRLVTRCDGEGGFYTAEMGDEGRLGRGVGAKVIE